MKKKLIGLAVLLAVLAGAGVLIWINEWSRSPEALLKKLARGKGNRDELVMQLNVCRGDLITPMVEAFNDKQNDASFRADVLELLIRRNARDVPAEHVEGLILQATKDPEPAIRRRAVQCIAVYMTDAFKACLVDCVEDPDPEIREQVYITMSAVQFHALDSAVWKGLSTEQRERLVKSCLKLMKQEEEEDLQRLAQGVVGREIERLGVESRKAFQSSDMAGAERLLREALALDTSNCQAQIRLVRYFLRIGQRDQALAMARQYGGLLEIPALSQAPVIDGDPTDQVWAEGFTAEQFYHTTSRWVQRPTQGKSRAHIGHFDGKIYIAVFGYEEDLDDLVVTQQGRDGNVWLDDCVEIIIDPDNTEHKFYQFIVNPGGALFDQSNGDKGKNFKCQYAARIFRDRGYWGCEFAIHGKDLDNHLIKPGQIWSMNVFRPRIGGASEHGVIWPLYGWAHRLDLYPLAIFK